MSRYSPKTDAQPISLEHVHLRELLLSVRETLATGDAERERLAGRLDELAEQVLDHFEHEEEGGYFAEVIGVAPRLCERANALLREHAEMARHLSEMRHCAAERSRRSRWWEELREEFEKFFERFSAHEAAENVLLQEAYWDDIGAED